MSKQIIITIDPQGNTTVEADGFKGSGCETATAAIERELGSLKARKRKVDSKPLQNHVRQ